MSLTSIGMLLTSRCDDQEAITAQVRERLRNTMHLGYRYCNKEFKG